MEKYSSLALKTFLNFCFDLEFCLDYKLHKNNSSLLIRRNLLVNQLEGKRFVLFFFVFCIKF